MRSVESELAGETEVLEQTPPECQFVHHNLAWQRTRAAATGNGRLTACP
jgi:hypothetical protein